MGAMAGTACADAELTSTCSSIQAGDALSSLRSPSASSSPRSSVSSNSLHAAAKPAPAPGVDLLPGDRAVPLPEVLHRYLSDDARGPVYNAAMREAAELRRQLAAEAATEASAISASAALREELQAAEADAEDEDEEHETIYPEVEEREARATQLEAELEAAERMQVDLGADVANLKADVAKLWKEANWARKYMGQAEARRAKLESAVSQAERSLSDQRAEFRAARVAGCVAGSDLRQELGAHQANEAREAARAKRGEEAAAELEVRQDKLRLELMQEEHQRSYLEQRVNSAQQTLSMSRGGLAAQMTRALG